jgi:diadenosine tetraphosphate (Ap4A) HIT family hydrolase
MSEARLSECRICAIASGKYALGEVDIPWLMGDHYMAFTSVGALVEGWSLAVPRAHSLNLLNDYTNGNFVEFAHAAVSAVEAIYGPVVVFEHGGQKEGSATNCGTSHAHLHIVPLGFSLQQAALEFDSELQWVSCSWRGLNEYAGEREYLFVADRFDGAETQGVVCILKQGQSQFFRRVIAAKIGRVDESNYRTHPNLATAGAGSKALRSLAGGSKAA